MGTVINGNTVSVHYRGTLEDGTEFDSSHNRGETLTFQVGSGQMIEGFDANVVGMKVGEIKNITLDANKAYGEHNSEAIQEVSKEVFPPDFEFVVGATVQGQGPNGQPVVAKILSEQDETATLDFNHPLAGHKLNFEIEMVEISET
jgi:FKBP-type peptidyl-prolyl cis-trans isomerase 2